MSLLDTLTDDLGGKIFIAGIFIVMLLVLDHRRGVIADLEAECERLETSLEAERKATARANDETRKLTARVAELRRKAVRKEDQLNETIRKKAQSDPCLDSHVDAAIIKQLRGTVTGSGSTSGAH